MPRVGAGYLEHKRRVPRCLQGLQSGRYCAHVLQPVVGGDQPPDQVARIAASGRPVVLVLVVELEKGKVRRVLANELGSTRHREPVTP